MRKKCGRNAGELREKCGKNAGENAGSLMTERFIVNKGMLYALGDASLYSLTKLAVKSVSSVTKMQISAFRAGLQFLILLPYCLKSQSSENLLPLSIDWSIQFKLAIRGIFGIAASVFHYYAIELLPLGDVSSLMFCQGFFTTILSWVFLGEALNLYDGALLFVTILGCACIAQPKLLIDYALGNIEDVSRVADLLTGLKLASIALGDNHNSSWSRFLLQSLPINKRDIIRD